MRRLLRGLTLRPGLLGKITLALALVGLVPLTLTPYLLELNRDAMTDQVLRTHALAARTTAARAEAFLASMQRPAQALAGNPQVSGAPRSAATGQLLAGLLQAEAAVAAITIENADGEEVIRVQDRSRAEAIGRVLALPRSGELIADGSDDLWLRLEMPLAGQNGRLRLVASGTALRELLEPEELGEEAALLIGDTEGGLIASSEPAGGLSAFPPDLITAARSRAGSGAGRYREARTGELVLGAFAPVPGSDWYVASRQPAAVAERVAVEMRRRFLFAVGLAGALTALLSFGAYRSVVRPLRELAAAHQRLARAAPLRRSRDEIGQLQASLELLEREVVDRDALGEIFLGRYQVIAVLGAGGMGTVFKGWDPKLQREVALKTVRLAAATAGGSHAEMVDGLLKEAVTVARISHPNVVAVFDVEDSPDAAFVAMEFVDGTSLHDFMPVGRAMTPVQVVPLAAAVARGLAAAHQENVIHRDVKPANILLGRNGAIKVGDFGIADLVHALAGKQDVVFGTPGYIPPEALQGKGLGPEGDLFSLGVIVYEMIGGRRPFGEGDLYEISRRTIQEPAPPLHASGGDFPAELLRLVESLLQKSPERRPSSAARVAEVLEGLAADRGWRWSPTITERGKKKAAEQSTLVQTATILGLRLDG